MFREITETIRSFETTSRKLRLFGIILVVVLAMAGFLAESRSVKITAFLASAVLIFLALALPAAIKPIWIGLMVITLPIGWIISRTILVALFYLIIAPMALVSRLLGKDILKMRWTKTPSYWEPFEENKNPDSMGL